LEFLRLDFANVMGDTITSENFLSRNDLEKIEKRVLSALEEVKEEKEKKEELSFLHLPNAYSEKYGKTIFGDTLWNAKEFIEQKAKLIRDQFSDYIQIGIGGSALGGIALYNALNNKKITGEKGNICTIHMPDNIDPDWLGEVLYSIDPEKTFLSVITKSGDTVETIANFFVFYNALKKKIPVVKLRDNLVIMTNPERGALAELSKKEGFTLIPIPDSVHGRFSVLSPGGLMTAAVSGINIDELLEGARVMNEATDKLSLWENPVLLYAAIHYLVNTQKNIDTLILMPYSQKLRTIADWYSQLVAESLGKNGKGVTPVKALGATDQHSQLQLYNDGPKNKFVTFFSVDKFNREIKIPAEFPEWEEYSYLHGHTINEFINSSRMATAFSLYKNGVPNCTIHIPGLIPFYMGQLFMLLEKVISILGKLYEINAFNQPGVEESKEYARAMLGKEGEKYDEVRKEIKDFTERYNIN
jgi:glucose-6-phosphate isomerase